jgi:DNA repair protein RadC
MLKELPISDRPRERLLANGPEQISDIELLTILIGSGTKGRDASVIAAEVLKVIGESNGKVSVDSLKMLHGLGAAKAATICAALEFCRRLLCPARYKISFPADVLPAISHFADRKQEHFLSISMNGAHEVIKIRTVSIGLVNRTLIHPREVYADPLTDRAGALIVAHNHPSGNTEPSTEDREVTGRLKKAGDTLGIKLLDHIIFGQRGYYSFLEAGECL